MLDLSSDIRNSLLVSVIQMNCRWNDEEANIREAERLMDSVEASQLYVLPEMWNTGFATHPERLATTSRAIDWMKKAAAERDAAICGSVAVLDGGWRNRFVFAKPDGEISFYDKRHLFPLGGESENYESGRARIIIKYRGWRFKPLVCYDLRFPAWCRNDDDCDALLVVANWPDTRIKAWDILTQARAIENQSFVIACNRCGDDPKNHYSGHSKIIAPSGEIIAEANMAQPTLHAEISKQQIENTRSNLDVLSDRDKITIYTI